LMVNRQARSTTGCYKSTNTGALVAEAGLRPATSLLDNRQRRFALRLAGLPSSDQARCVVGAKDAWTAAGASPLVTNWLARTNGSNHPDNHRRPPLRRSHHRGHRRCGYQDGQRVAGDGDLDGRITARGWLCLLRSRTAPSRAQRVDRSAGPHGQEPGGLRR